MVRKFNEEFKKDAVNLVVVQGVSQRQAAKDLGIGDSTLSKWVRQHRDQNKDVLVSENEREELKRLKAENYKLRLERDLLKKATVFFANNHSD